MARRHSRPDRFTIALFKRIRSCNSTLQEGKLRHVITVSRALQQNMQRLACLAKVVDCVFSVYFAVHPVIVMQVKLFHYVVALPFLLKALHPVGLLSPRASSAVALPPLP